MKNQCTALSAFSFAALIFLAGCGNGDAPRVRPAPPAPEPEPPAATVSEITIAGNDQMQFDITEFAVAAGSEVTVTLHNIGQMPKEQMGHNLVILERDVDPIAFSNASAAHPDNEFIDPGQEDKVIAATKILGPDERETLTFTAPDEPGDYPFVCSFPGHTAVGMRGVIRVQ